MGDSRKPDASQRQELVWLLDEADSAIEPWLQTEEKRWPEILTKLVSRLRLCGFDPEAAGIASEVQATPKLGRRGCCKRGELRQHRQRVVERVRKRIAAIRKVIADKPPIGQKSPKSINAVDADAVARRLDKDEVTFRHLTAKDMAKRIEQESGKRCSASLVKSKLPFWREAMTATGRGRKRGDAKGQGRKRGTAARPVNFSKDLEAVLGYGTTHEVLEDLAEDEERAEAERALQEQRQVIHLVECSRLKPEEKRDTIAKLEVGEMTPQQATQVVSMCQQDSTRNQKKTLRHD